MFTDSHPPITRCHGGPAHALCPRRQSCAHYSLKHLLAHNVVERLCYSGFTFFLDPAHASPLSESSVVR